MVEVVIASFIISLVTLALMSAASSGIKLSERMLAQAQAGMITEEGVEAVKTIRDNSWATVSGYSFDTDYYLSFNTGSNSWTLSTTPTSFIDGRFDRKIRFYRVYRDDSDNITSYSADVDSESREVQVITSWTSDGEVLSRQISFYISNIFE